MHNSAVRGKNGTEITNTKHTEYAPKTLKAIYNTSTTAYNSIFREFTKSSTQHFQ